MANKKNPVLSLRPTKREKLADVVYGQILEQMTSGHLKIGDKLPAELEFCTVFGVSRPVVREALTRLQADGLVVSNQGAGTFVCKEPPADMMKFARSEDMASYLRSYEVRIGLESEAARLAAKNRTEKQLKKIKKAMKNLRHAYKTESTEGFEDFEFHVAIAEATGNELFTDLLNLLKSNITGQMSLGNALTHQGSTERRNQLLSEHERIAEAIEAADTDAAALYMRYHLIQARARSIDAKRDF